jgi:hypothetical protein
MEKRSGWGCYYREKGAPLGESHLTCAFNLLQWQRRRTVMSLIRGSSGHLYLIGHSHKGQSCQKPAAQREQKVERPLPYLFHNSTLKRHPQKAHWQCAFPWVIPREPGNRIPEVHERSPSKSITLLQGPWVLKPQRGGSSAGLTPGS